MAIESFRSVNASVISIKYIVNLMPTIDQGVLVLRTCQYMVTYTSEILDYIHRIGSPQKSTMSNSRCVHSVTVSHIIWQIHCSMVTQEQ